VKHEEIIKILEGKFKNIDKLRGQILKDFNEDDIHDFRVEVKKIRAFLRLLDVKKKGSIIPKLLKTFYGYIGIVRNIQLHEHNLFKYTEAHNIKNPQEYIKLLENEKSYWKNEADDLMQNNNFRDAKEKIIKELPAKFEKPVIIKFFQNKLDELNAQLEYLHDDYPLHNIRKILKDILYNYDYIKYSPDLPGAISNEEALKSLTTKLGNFINKCAQLEFLQPVYLNKIQQKEEKIILSTIKTNLLKQKRALKQQLQPELNILRQQIHDFKY
jgi:CHAD domain-containing protein